MAVDAHPNDDDLAPDRRQAKPVDTIAVNNANPVSGLPRKHDPVAPRRSFKKRPPTMVRRVNVDFIPEGTNTAPIVPALAEVFHVALAGGGAKPVNVWEPAADLAVVAYGVPVCIPPCVALVIRAVLVPEGIARVRNPGFAVRPVPASPSAW
mmetsp:Transcript_5772/g.11843  ORF Transcript_5772/g.11843 Transcript_5772/m.11843 type:complete len:152 (+) Transcript_5772:254-709(+)